MQIIKQNTGVEVDQKYLKVSFQFLTEDQNIKIKGSRKFDNTPSGFASLEQWLEKKRLKDLPVHLTMEATGVYSENAAYYFEEKSSYVVHVLLPNTSKAFFRSYNIKSKTDEIDAKGLALMGLERKLPVWKPASPQMRLLRKLIRERLRLQREKTMVSNQLHAEKASKNPETSIISRYQERIDLITDQIQQIELQLQEEVKKDSDLQKKIENICKAPGIGFITAIGVVAELHGFVLFKNRSQIVSYCGYDVVKKESGTSVRGKTRISKKGNSNVRQILYMAAMGAARYDEHHKAYYKRIVQKTGIKMKGNVAIQRKLLLLIFALFDLNNPYQQKHYEQVRKKLGSKNKQQQQNRTNR